MCPHKDLFYCFINKRKTLGIYIDLSSLWTPSLHFLSLGVGRAFSVCGIHCWKPHSPRRNSVSTSFPLPKYGLSVILLFCQFTPAKWSSTTWKYLLTWNRRTCIYLWHTWNLTFKMSPVPTIQLPPNQWSLTVSPAWHPLNFQTSHLEFCHPVPRSLLYVTHLFLPLKEMSVF